MSLEEGQHTIHVSYFQETGHVAVTLQIKDLANNSRYLTCETLSD